MYIYIHTRRPFRGDDSTVSIYYIYKGHFIIFRPSLQGRSVEVCYTYMGFRVMGIMYGNTHIYICGLGSGVQRICYVADQDRAPLLPNGNLPFELPVTMPEPAEVSSLRTQQAELRRHCREDWL